MREARTVSRDLDVTVIPYGEKIPLKQGVTVYITQSLGGSYTAMTDMGYMVRIEGKDADAIGETVQAGPSAEDLAAKPLVDLAWDQLKTCYDPEIPVNIVDLGLVYSCDVEPAAAGGQKVVVRFSLTAPGCGMGPILQSEVRDKVLGIPGVKFANIEVVFEPAWSQSMMSDAAKLQLGMM